MEKHFKQKTVVLAAFILGILIAIYLKTLDPSKVYITLEQRREIESDIEYAKDEIKKLKDLKAEFENKLNEYKEVAEDSSKDTNEVMEEELDYLKKISGYSKVTGSGVIVTVQDSEKELEKGQNPNDLIVHDIDILRILNDLKKSGAEAISINGERVIPTSKVKCSGATITVNDTTYGQPFVIKAIGDVDALKAAMISPESYTNLLTEGYGIYVDVQESNDIIINSYEKNK
ncbi:DUF881 domain-containing protein [Romboutsia weinsteinii]|uniref:DUF881 domain-containing protein n=1 Tax=Romboutsia weinsteinii TaxID=2020949 RepID=A0A371IZ29_9FIRM|nr:DUF881 domain-containing protein [Romboutsia weinsteinii]RDY25724.1 DUF881 domain-containing protein [Romboutsia weinsteinii]